MGKERERERDIRPKDSEKCIYWEEKICEQRENKRYMDKKEKNKNIYKRKSEIYLCPVDKYQARNKLKEGEKEKER